MGGDCVPPPHQRYSDRPDAHRAGAKRRRKYLFTDQIDQLIREIYLSHAGATTGPVRRLVD